MTLVTSERSFCIHLIAASPAASLVIPSIASLLGIEPSEATRRLSSLPTTIADRVPEPQARRLSNLLTLFGLTVRLDPVLFLPGFAGLDLAVQRVGDASIDAEIPLVAKALALAPTAVGKAFANSGAVTLHGLEQARAEAIRMSLRSRKALRVIASDPAQAKHLLFCASRRSPAWTEARRLGLAACRFTGAAATGINLATARHLERFTVSGDRIVNRDFLRFDLLADMEQELVGSELLDFLATRPDSRGRMAADGTVRVEADLSFTSAWQFAKDYAAIGLTVRSRIRGQSS